MHHSSAPNYGDFNGDADHVHLLVHNPPKIALSTLVGSLKSVSARRLRQEFSARIHRYLCVWGALLVALPLRLLRGWSLTERDQGLRRTTETLRLTPTTQRDLRRFAPQTTRTRFLLDVNTQVSSQAFAETDPVGVASDLHKVEEDNGCTRS